MDKKKRRYPALDYIRGTAVALMIIFHFSYDLKLFGFVDIDFSKDLFWFAFPRVIVTLFMFSVGCGLFLGHKKEIQWGPFLKRATKIILFAIIIIFSTYFMFPKSWVYFGTLHSIALTSFLALPFLKYPRLALFTALVLIIPHLFFGIEVPWFRLPHKSMDYIPPFPWLGVVLLGVYSAQHNWLFYSPNEKAGLKLLRTLGEHSLLIYMLHQPILYGLIWALYKFTV